MSLKGKGLPRDVRTVEKGQIMLQEYVPPSHSWRLAYVLISIAKRGRTIKETHLMVSIVSV